MTAHSSEAAYTLLEVMVAAVIVVILALGLAGSMGAAFMADASARNTAASVHAAQQTLEELQQLDYGDVLACDADAILTPEGVAVKIAASEVMVGMLLVEVFACRPVEERTLAELSGLTMEQFKNIEAAMGSRVRVVTYRAGR